MRIELINLPAPFLDEPGMDMPLGLCSIGGSLKAAGFDDIHLLDFCAIRDQDYWKTDYLKLIPDREVYCISCLTPQYHWLVEVVRYIKSTYPASQIIVGGPHATHLPDEIKEDLHPDFVIEGDGEYQMVGLLKTGSIMDMSMHINPNAVADPDRSLGNGYEYHRQMDGERCMHVISARDCPFYCAFCSNEGYYWRQRSVGSVLAELEAIIRDYGVRSFVFYDDTFTLNKPRLAEMCHGLKTLNVKWRCFTRTDSVTRDDIRRMRDCGLRSLTVGVESGDQSQLDRMGKHSTVKANELAILNCHDLGVPIRIGLIYGCPGETRQTVENTVRFMAKTQPDDYDLAVLCPMPGSRYWRSGEVKFDKTWLRNQQYLPCTRFHVTDGYEPWIDIGTMTRAEFSENLRWMIKTLETVAPRKRIQDTLRRMPVA